MLNPSILLLILLAVILFVVWLVRSQRTVRHELASLRDELGAVRQRHAELDEMVTRQIRVLSALQRALPSMGLPAVEAEAIATLWAGAPEAVLQSLGPGVMIAEPVEAISGADGRGMRPAQIEAPAAPQQAAKDETVASVTAPAGPSLGERIGSTMQESPLVRWFVGAHLVIRVAVVILFFGVAFLLSYAVDQGWLTVETRLIGAAILGAALTILGWRLHNKEGRRTFAVTLQGGGLGIVYMTIFAALRLYALLSPTLAFGLLLLLVALGGGLAVANNALSLAILAMAGGFAAPFLTSSGEGSHIILLTYYLILNAGVVGIAWFKAWRPLNLLAFVFTLVLGGAWGVVAYGQELFATTEPFLIAFALFYVAISLLFARRTPAGADAVDTAMVFGTPVAFLGLQAALVTDMPNAMAYTTLATGIFYLLLGTLLHRPRWAPTTVLRWSYVLIGIVAVSLTVPLAFDERWTSGIWALEGAGMVWIGLQRRRLSAWGLGIVLQGASAFFLFTFLISEGIGDNWADPFYIGSILVSVASLVSAYLLRNKELADDRDTSVINLNLFGGLMGSWGLAWWFGGGLYWISVHADWLSPWAAMLAAFLAISVLAFEEIGRRLDWTLPRLSFLGLGPGLAVLAILCFAGAAFFDDSLSWWVLLIWPLAYGSHQYVLLRQDDRGWATTYHMVGLWLLALIAGLGTLRLIAATVEVDFVWGSIGLLGPSTLILIVLSLPGIRAMDVVRRHSAAYHSGGPLPLVLVGLAWGFIANIASSGEAAGFAYVPVLNPLELLLLLVYVALWRWLAAYSTIYGGDSRGARIRTWWRVAFILLGFLTYNAILARSAHHLLDVPFGVSALLDSAILQAIYSVSWSAIALVLMFWANRTARRWAWMAGAALLGVTVIKLFLVDLSRVDTVPRIISFIGVGLLMLAIGYFAPAPSGTEKLEPPKGGMASAGGALSG